MTRLRQLALCGLLALLSGCYHLAYNQATYAVEHGDYVTAADKDLEALENAPDSPEARALWERIWPRYRQIMVGVCEAAAADPDPTALAGHLAQLDKQLRRTRSLKLPIPDLTQAQLDQWYNLGASKAYQRGETAEAGKQARDAAEWYRLVRQFRSDYRDSEARFERNRRAAYVVLRVGRFSSSGDGTLSGLGLDDQARSLLLQGLQPLHGDFLGILSDQPAPDWALRRYRLSGTASVATSEPVDSKETGVHQGLVTVPNGTPKTESVWYTRHHVVRKVSVTLNLTIHREADDSLVWQHGFTDSASTERRWLVVDRGPKAILPGYLQDEADNPSSPPAWDALQDEAGVEASQTALRTLKTIVSDLR